jgi:hypothetical protein
MLVVSILQLKDTDWQTGLKHKTQTFVAYQKYFSLAKILSKQMKPKTRQE